MSISNLNAAVSTLVLAAGGLAMISIGAFAQTYPNKPITFIAPSGPGGGNDVIARIIAQKVNETSSQPLVVENRSGATGTVAMDMTAKALPDGHTIVVASTSHIINQFVSKVRYDVVKDYAPVTLSGALPYVLAVSSSSSARSISELVAAAKSRPGKINYAGQTGGVSHLMGEMLKSAKGIEITFIPYKTTIDAQADVLSGRVEIWFTTTASALPQVKAGKLRALGVSSESRISTLPDVQTMNEAGLPSLNVSVSFFILAPAGTPRPIIDALNSQFVSAMGTNDVKQRFAAAGLGTISSTPEEASAHIKREVSRWSAVVKDSGIRVD